MENIDAAGEVYRAPPFRRSAASGVRSRCFYNWLWDDGYGSSAYTTLLRAGLHKAPFPASPKDNQDGLKNLANCLLLT
jgi:hypothetical protein